jgi:shikimate kinase
LPASTTICKTAWHNNCYTEKMKRKGISLIGFPASGKSTIGRHVAKKTGLPMLDIDRWMEERVGTALSEIIRTNGAEYTLNLETTSIRGRDLGDMIVSTPGSIIYNDVYDHLAEYTDIVWLDVPFEELKRRLETDAEHLREIIGIKEKGLDGLFAERRPLYEKWAHHRIDCEGKTAKQIATEIVDLLC